MNEIGIWEGIIFERTLNCFAEKYAKHKVLILDTMLVLYKNRNVLV